MALSKEGGERRLEKLKLTYKSSISDFTRVNSSFDSGVLRVCYTGDNRNGSSISREAIERCIHTIYNCPIVCNYDRDTDSIGEHDMDIVMKDGTPVLVNETQPIGVVPTGANWWFDVDDGHEYLCVEVLIWKRQEAYAHVKENGITDESMEIAVTAYHMDKDVVVIDEFEFNAFCLLESAEPCYEGASLVLFGLDEFRAAYDAMIEDLKNSYRKEEQDLEEKNKLLTQFGLTAEQLEIEDLETIELEDLKDMCESYSLTAGQLEEQILEALFAEKYTDEWGTWARYIYIDYEIESHTVFAVDTQDNYNLYGLTYKMNGDNVIIDFATPVRKKVSYVDFDEGETQSAFSLLAADVFEVGSARSEKIQEDLKAEFAQKEEAANAKIVELTNEVEELKQFKASVLDEQRAAEVAAVFAQFEDLEEIEAFKSLKEDYGDMTLDEIEEKCFSIRGRNMQLQFSQKKSTKAPARIPAKMPKAEDEPYGGLFEKYPPHN